LKRPSFQFYPADWRNNLKLRLCSEAARGAWMDVLCLMHDSEEYGVLRSPLRDIARAGGLPLRLLRELSERRVMKGADTKPEPFLFTPRHAGKDGEPVLLVPTTGAACWYSSRLVRDEWVRLRRGGDTRFGATPDPSPIPPIGDGSVDGSTSTSSTTGVSSPSVANAPSGAAPDPVKLEIWQTGRLLLETSGLSRDAAGSFLGKLCKDYGQKLVLDAVRDCARATPVAPQEWLVARCQERRDNKPNKQVLLEQRNRAAAEEFLRAEDSNAGT
jgi:hypothetical protein